MAEEKKAEVAIVTTVAQSAPVVLQANPNSIKSFLKAKGKNVFLTQIQSKTPEEAEELFARESAFAMQVISGKGKEYLIKTIAGNAESFMFAIANCAASGLTLSPELNLAYLVPRDGKVMFQSSYQGKREIVIRSGLVKDLFAVLVYEKDEFFAQKGTNPKIEHKPNWFGDRGKLVGAYATAFLNNGQTPFEIMTYEEVMAIKERSPAAKSGRSPWQTDEGEMIKKTLINRLFKSLPKLAASPELMKLIHSDNEIESYEPIKKKTNDFLDETE